MMRHNPLLIMDALSQKIVDYKPRNLKLLYPFYQNMAGVYRYKYGDSQLEILWDGVEHIERYKQDWSLTFEKWTIGFCEHHQFLMAVMDLTIFLPLNRKAHLAENRMNSFITQYFELKIHKHRGIVEMEVA